MRRFVSTLMIITLSLTTVAGFAQAKLRFKGENQDLQRHVDLHEFSS